MRRSASSSLVSALAAALALALALTLALTLAPTRGARAEDASPVRALADATFDAALASAPGAGTLVEFYAPWCGHCKALEPVYDAVARKLAGKVLFAKVDATSAEAETLAKRFDIQGFPTLKFFPKNLSPADKPVEFSGKRTEDGIARWLAKRLGPSASKLVTSSAELAAIRDAVAAPASSSDSASDSDADAESRVAVVGVFRTEAEASAFEKRAVDDDDREYHRVVGGPALADAESRYGVKAPAVVVVRGFSPDAPATTTDAAVITDAGKLDAFVRKSSEPPSDVVSLSDKEFAAAIAERGGKPHLVEFYAPWCGYCKQLAPKYERLAKRYLDAGSKVVVAKLDGTAYEELAASQRIEAFPTIKLFKDGMVAVYRDGELEEDAIAAWVEAKLSSGAAGVSEAQAADAVKASQAGDHVVVARASKARKTLVDRIAFASSGKTSVLFVEGGAAGKETVTLYRGGREVSTFDGSLDDDKAFESWRQRALIPSTFRFNDDTFEAVMAAKLKSVVFLFVNAEPLPESTGTGADEDVPDHPELSSHPLVKVMTQFAETANKDKDVAFTYGDAEEDAYLLEYFRVSKEQVPCVRVLDVSQDAATVTFDVPDVGENELKSVDTFARIVEDWREGRLPVVQSRTGEEEGGEGEAEGDAEVQQDGDQDGDEDGDDDGDEDEDDEPHDEL